MPCVYILQSEINQRYYVGSTIDLERRFQEHCNGQNISTKNILPVKVVFSQEYPTIQEARQIELWLKKMKSRTLIERIITDGHIEYNPLKMG